MNNLLELQDDPEVRQAPGFTYFDRVVARVLDFFAKNTPWQRRLWTVSSVLALRELWEAGEWVEGHALSQAAMTWMCRSLEPVLGRDRGIGERELRAQLTDCLRRGLSRDSRHRRCLQELIELIDEDYLDRWAAAAACSSPPSPERLARAVAAHLLDCGFSPAFLHRWTRGVVHGGAGLPQLLEESATLVRQPDRTFEILAPFESVPRQSTLTSHIREWRSAPAVAEWLARHAGGTAGIRQNGGFVYEIKAKDQWAAAQQVGQIVERLLARSALAHGCWDRMRPLEYVWVAGRTEPFDWRVPPRGVDVLSLVLEQQMYVVTQPGLIDDALELVAPLNQGPPGTAVSGGWAAIESLLFESGDDGDRQEGHAVAADRLAALVACSWPRAELTTLSYRHRPTEPDRLSHELGSAATNRERALLVANALRSGRTLALARPADMAAELRVRDLLDAPRPVLRRVEEYVRRTLRQLYRQRNIVLHAGATQPVALSACLRASAPLVGAGLDRITHAYLASGTKPLQIAARARLRLDLVGCNEGRSVVDLLE